MNRPAEPRTEHRMGPVSNAAFLEESKPKLVSLEESLPKLDDPKKAHGVRGQVESLG